MPMVLEDNAVKVLEKRYLDGGTVDDLWDRVSGGNERFRRLLSEGLGMPNSPTLFNAEKNNGCTLSACFVFNIADSMFGKNSIMETRNKAAAVAKAGGGVGYYGGFLRKKGSPVNSTHRKACGTVAVLRDLHALSSLITQGGKRELAQLFVQDSDHGDIEEFIHCKHDDPQGLGSFNISVGWRERWLQEVFKVDEYLRKSSQRNLWDRQCKEAWHHGCPGMFFPDQVNKFNFNKHLGLLLAANPCGETPNRNNEPCNLFSLVLGRFFSPGNRTVDWNRLEEAAYEATLFCDDILDRNVFPHPDIIEAALLTRKLGLGVMGWADLLAMCHIHYDTQEAVDLGEKVMKLIQDVSHQASEDLAVLKGPFKGYHVDKSEMPARRNETTTSIAPTGTIHIITGCKGSSIEPWFALSNSRTTAEGMKLQENVPEWIKERLDGFVPKLAHEIAPEWHVKHQAAFQRYTDLGVSKTINLPNSATVEDVSHIYHMMWESGCKGGTIYRDGCRDEQVLTATKTMSVYSLPSSANGVISSPTNAVLNGKRKMPAERDGKIVKFKVDGTELYLSVGLRPDGTVGEIFVNGNFGTTMAGLLNSFCITFSVALQNGVPLIELVKHHRNTRFEPSGVTDNADIPICTSLPDLIVRWLQKRFLPDEKPEPMDSGVFCPDCGAVAVYSGGCLTCSSQGCGWSRCG